MFATASYDYNSPFTMATEYSASKPIYIGEAEPGTLKASTGWRIKKITYSGDDATDIQWAGGNRNMDKIWDNRTSYTYK